MLQALLSGLATGAIYGLIAMGFSFAFYVTRVINFAQGQLLMVAIMITAAGAAAGWPVWISIGLGMVGSCVLGALLYLLAVRPVIRMNRFSFAWLVTTLGAAVVLENAAALIWGPTSRAFPTLYNGISIHVGSAVVTLQQIITIVIALIFMGIFEWLRTRTLYGKIGMAIASDPEMAAAVGVNTTRVALWSFVVAGLFAGMAGILVGPITFANPYLGDTYGIYGFVAMMIGGTEKPFAAMIGGLLLGVLGEGANAVINSQASDWFPFVVLLAILIISPEGLFGGSGSLRRILKVKKSNEVLS